MYHSRRTKLINLKFMNPTTNFVKTSLLSECVVLHDAVTFIKSSLNVEGISQGIGADPFCKFKVQFLDTKSEKGRIEETKSRICVSNIVICIEKKRT